MTATEEPKQITVAQLRGLLGQVPDNAPVWLEGCDCWGKASGVLYDIEGGGSIVLTRTDTMAGYKGLAEVLPL